VTTSKRVREAIKGEQTQANDYIVKILDLLPSVPDEAIPEIASHLAIALGQARAAVRQRKEERGLPLGTDTKLASQEEMEHLRRDFQRDEEGDERP